MINCTNHPHAAGHRLCTKCGQWFCQQCMNNASSASVCRSCSATNHIKSVEQYTVIQKQFLQLPFKWKASIASIAITIIASLSYFVHSAFVFPLIITSGMALISLLPKKITDIKQASKGISDAQVATSLKISKNRLTPQLLAQKTQTNIEMASKKLSEMYADGKLEIQEEEGVLFYSVENADYRLPSR